MNLITNRLYFNKYSEFVDIIYNAFVAEGVLKAPNDMVGRLFDYIYSYPYIVILEDDKMLNDYGVENTDHIAMISPFSITQKTKIVFRFKTKDDLTIFKLSYQP